MKRNKRILYLLNVSWFWIKQRPQFLAESISKFYHVNVICLDDHNSGGKVKNHRKNNLTLSSLRIIKTKSKFVPFLNFNLRRFQLFVLNLPNTIIWFTSPLQFSLMKRIVRRNQIVIYDCMDNIPEFFDGEMKERVTRLEKELVSRANLIIASSKNLKNYLEHSYSVADRVVIVNNALNQDLIQPKTIPNEIRPFFDSNTRKKIVYLGTVSHWFDFESVEFSLVGKEIDLIIFGPKDCSIPAHSKIKYAGIIDHNIVNAVMELSDALIMPFKITNLVRGVNPVKAYEYISSGKPVILSGYEETEAFKDFVYLYRNKGELDSLLSRLENNELPPKKCFKECRKFALNNTWLKRAEEINSHLAPMLG